jgi:hypothetical protein
VQDLVLRRDALQVVMVDQNIELKSIQALSADIKADLRSWFKVLQPISGVYHSTRDYADEEAESGNMTPGWVPSDRESVGLMMAD